MSRSLSYYRSLVDAETRWMCHIISPAFILQEFNIQDFTAQVNPLSLLEKLKRHRLYPVFYKVWAQIENKPQQPEWQHFQQSLKKMVETNRLKMMQKTGELIRIARAFEQANIPLISLKGPALAQQLYGDIAMRYSWDLDFLVHPNFIVQAMKVLENQGYQNIYGNKSLTSKQYSYTLLHFQHFTYINTQTNVCVEIHWTLPQLTYFTNLNVDKIFSESDIISIAGTLVRILDDRTQTAYLIAHGAFHSFYRLSWLCDAIYCRSSNYDNENYNFLSLYQTTQLLNQVFYEIDSKSDKYINKRYLLHSLKIINQQSEKSLKPTIIQEYWGKLLITKGGVLKNSFLGFFCISPRDWDIIQLPDSLFFLYFILRPFLFLYRKLKR